MENQIPYWSQVSLNNTSETALLILYIVRIALLLAIEYAWNVYPSTVVSSGVLCLANLALVIGVWFGYSEGLHVVSKSE